MLLAGAMAAVAEERAREPFEMIRSLRVLQDQIVRGNADAHHMQRQVMNALSAELASVDRQLWKEPRNLRAAVLYVLGGGDPGILRSLLSTTGLSAEIERLMRGALAYAEGRSRESAEHLSTIEVRTLDPGIAGTIALIQAVLAAEANPGRAVALLDEARLLSPGTLVEEVALRRQILLLPSAGRLDRLEPLLSRYIRRFASSHYASAFWLQLAALLAGLAPDAKPELVTHLDHLIAAIPDAGRQQLYLAIAREAIARGRVRLTRFAAARAMQHDNADTVKDRPAKLYEAAALIVTDEYARGLSNLTAMSGEMLSAPDAGLLDAAVKLARQIRRPPEPDVGPADGQPATSRAQELSAIGLTTIGRAKTVLASADAVLSGETR